jgi:hypothetical protein
MPDDFGDGFGQWASELAYPPRLELPDLEGREASPLRLAAVAQADARRVVPRTAVREMAPGAWHLAGSRSKCVFRMSLPRRGATAPRSNSMRTEAGARTRLADRWLAGCRFKWRSAVEDTRERHRCPTTSVLTVGIFCARLSLSRFGGEASSMPLSGISAQRRSCSCSSISC